MISRILSWLFPPVLPGYVRDWSEREEYWPHEEGSAEPPKLKKYRDGIDRHFAEQGLSIGTPVWQRESFTTFMARHSLQLHNAEKEIAAVEKDMLAQGYTNTIHDCWEKEETE